MSPMPPAPSTAGSSYPAGKRAPASVIWIQAAKPSHGREPLQLAPFSQAFGGVCAQTRLLAPPLTCPSQDRGLLWSEIRQTLRTSIT